MRVTRIGGPRNSSIGLSSSSFSAQPAYKGGLAGNWDDQLRYSAGSTMEDRIRGRRGFAAAKRDFGAYFSRNDPRGGPGPAARPGGGPYGAGGIGGGMASHRQTGMGAWPGDAPYGVGESDEERATLERTGAEAHRLSSMFGDRGMMDLFNGLGGLANV